MNYSRKRPSARAVRNVPARGPIVEYATVVPWRVDKEFTDSETGASVAVWRQAVTPVRWSIQVGMRLPEAVSLRPYIPVRPMLNGKIVDVASVVADLVDEAQAYIENEVRNGDRARTLPPSESIL